MASQGRKCLRSWRPSLAVRWQLIEFYNQIVTRPVIVLTIIGAREVGFAMARITKNDAEQAIIREWRALPEIKRQADSHAEWFAMMIKDKYPFRHSGSDRYQAVHKIIIRYQNLIGSPLK
jgi:hypothetical protein